MATLSISLKGVKLARMDANTPLSRAFLGDLKKRVFMVE